MKNGIFLLVIFACAFAHAETINVSPANFNDEAIWRRVEQKLAVEPMTVVFGDGMYYPKLPLTLANVGHEKNTLTLRGAAHGKAVFQDDPEDRGAANTLLELRACRNIIVKDLAFTGPQRLSGAMHIIDCQGITLEGCRFIDLPGAVYSALSITADKASDITINNCVFRRVGADARAHMIYVAYGPQRVRMVNCEFEDCAGDFVRFRDETDYGVVFNCTFKSTGRYHDANPPMITIPMFNDDNPASQPATPNYEFFGTHFLFANNTFEYSDRGLQGTRWAIMFHHVGYNPPGRTHLLSKEQAASFNAADPAGKKSILKNLTAIDPSEVHVFGNTLKHVDKAVIYRGVPNFGAASSGFQGVLDLTDLVDANPVVKSADEAIKYFPEKSE